ncbi:hypothetical protein N2599_08435 [Rhizobium sullae]|uniref:Uncharacterized protein n=1 Tax=Rhizobium sullae TaxID=50338 RepID=A0ABY5XN32_RHISU|nr:hypothetical protein [Rhizobium sullae]UWU16008.1 hypothetical protein N2599_08435 [Rhizobium sullae]
MSQHMTFINMRRFKDGKPGYGYEVKALVAFELPYGIIIQNARLTWKGSTDGQSGYRLRPPQSKFRADGFYPLNWNFQNPELRLKAAELGRVFERMEERGIDLHKFAETEFG